MSKQDIILVVNAGSSSLKFKIFTLNNEVLGSGQVSSIDVCPKFKADNAAGERIKEHLWEKSDAHNHSKVLEWLLAWIKEEYSGYNLAACGHRVVHGGTIFTKSTIINKDTLAKMEELTKLAPLHQPHNLRVIKLLRETNPTMPQVAVFDTSFHQSMEGNATYYAIPYELYKEGIRRYGFHGTSYAFIVHEMRARYKDFVDKKMVVAHIGSGASLCAIKEGKSVMTTMGLTALEGVPMGTRGGLMDPGIILYMVQERGLSPKELENWLYYKCGMQGLSNGFSSDFYELECALEKSEDARRAYGFMVYRVAEEIAKLSVSLGGMEVLVFTAGVGENSAKFRADVCAHLGHMGVIINPYANAERGTQEISCKDSKVKILTIPTNEELMIALDTKSVLNMN